MSETLPELDKRAVYERLENVLRIIRLSKSVSYAAFELFDTGRSCNKVRFLRDLEVLEASTELIKTAEEMVEDLMENPPTISETADIKPSSIR